MSSSYLSIIVLHPHTFYRPSSVIRRQHGLLWCKHWTKQLFAGSRSAKMYATHKPSFICNRPLYSTNKLTLTFCAGFLLGRRSQITESMLVTCSSQQNRDHSIRNILQHFKIYHFILPSQRLWHKPWRWKLHRGYKLYLRLWAVNTKTASMNLMYKVNRNTYTAGFYDVDS